MDLRHRAMAVHVVAYRDEILLVVSTPAYAARARPELQPHASSDHVHRARVSVGMICLML